MPATQAIFLALRVFTLGRTTSNYIDEPFAFIVATESGLKNLDQNKINELQARASVFNRQLDAIMLACPDITVRSSDFNNKLKEFGETIQQLRKDYIDETVENIFPNIQALIKAWGNRDRNPIPDFPPGAFIFTADNKIVFRELEMNEIIKYRLMHESAIQHKKAREEFDRLIDGRGKPVFKEARQILLGKRPLS